jgi:uncharacterized protein (TIGR04562 family)
MNRNQLDLLKSKYDFKSDVLDIIIGGKSSLDASNPFEMKDMTEANRFILSYGYDLENPIEQAEILGNFHEAIHFIRKTFLQPENPTGLRLEIPRKILEITHIQELFLMVSKTHPSQKGDSNDRLLHDWSCSILKVMHTIAHIDKDLRSAYFSDIQKQIFDRFYKLIYRDADGNLYLGENPSDPLRIPLVAFETKPKKSRESTILKLLHKPENVAEDIFDRVGIRFITETPLSALRVVKYLKDKMVVIPPNIKPSRSRNTLIQIEPLKKKLEELFHRDDLSSLKEPDLEKALEHLTHIPEFNPANPHSSEFYRAIQFTCRQLIKLKNPLYEDLRELRSLTREKTLHENILKILDRIDFKNIQRDIRFFYPYEVQIMDQQSAEENEKGKSSHTAYKKAQVQTALQRVMGNLAHAPG